MKRFFSCFAVLAVILTVVVFLGATVFNLTLPPAPTNVPTSTPRPASTLAPSATPTLVANFSPAPDTAIGVTIIAPGTALPSVGGPTPTPSGIAPVTDGLGTLYYPLTVTADGYLAGTRVASYLNPHYATWTQEALLNTTLFPAMTQTKAARKR